MSYFFLCFFVLLLRIGWRSRPYTDRYFQSIIMSAFQMGYYLPRVTISLFARSENVTMIKKNALKRARGYQSHFHVPISLQVTFISVQISLVMSMEHLSYFHFPLFPLTIRTVMTKITFPSVQCYQNLLISQYTFSCSKK